jgi:hypothetical protein
MYEERPFRPFDIDARVEGFFRDARLLVAGNLDVFVEAGQSRTVTEPELTSGNFQLELARDGRAFDQLMDELRSGIEPWGDPRSIGLLIIASSSYLKLAQIVICESIDEVSRLVDLGTDPVADPFLATHHGCDIEVSLVLLEQAAMSDFEPWRKGTWLARSKFGLRTSIEGFGYLLHPLTDEERVRMSLPSGCLRYVDVPVSPLDESAGAGGSVNVYVDADLLVRLEKESSRPWAIAFTDQLALDFLMAIVLRASAVPEFREVEWGQVSGSLLGSVIEAVAKTSDAETLEHYLYRLQEDPNRFVAMIEGMLDMRANSKRMQVG